MLRLLGDSNYWNILFTCG